MAKGGDGKVSGGLVAASCAAILAVYTAGYSRTREAAEKFEAQAQERRPAARSERTPAVQTQNAAAASATEVTQSVRETEAPLTRAVDASPAAPAASATTERIVEPVNAPVAAPAPAETAVVAAPPIVAPAPAPAPAPLPAPPVVSKWKDGTYTGWGTSRHGDIEARVVIHEGRIVEAGISQCLTRYSCDVIDALIPQPVRLQSPDVDYVSRATESSDAFYYALVEALGKAAPAGETTH
jgi:uncharacterized protein with FMN-binding domain